MRRNLWLAVALAVTFFVVYVILPAPWKCGSGGCAADIARRWNASSPAEHLGWFVFQVAAAFATLQWFGPYAMAYRARARARMWGHPPPE